MLDVGLGTTAAPTFFRHHVTDDYELLDGGFVSNNPAMIALVDALTCFAIDRRQVHILSIGCGSRRPVLTRLQKALGGRLTWTNAYEGFNYYGSRNADGQAGLLVGRDQLHRYEPTGPSALIGMTDYRSAGQLLPEVAHADAELALPKLRDGYFGEPTTAPIFYH